MFVLCSVTRLLCSVRLEPFPSGVHILDLRHLNIRFSEPLLTDLGFGNFVISPLNPRLGAS